MAVDFFSFAQIVGYVALITYALAYLIKDDNKLKLAFCFSNIFWIWHYFLINAHTAAITTAIIVTRNFFSLSPDKIPPHRKTLYICIFSLALVIAGAFTWAGYVSLIPVITGVIATWSTFYLAAIPYRTTLLGLDTAWLVHGILVDSISGIVYAVGALAVNAYTIFSMVKEKQLLPLQNTAGKAD